MTTHKVEIGRIPEADIDAMQDYLEHLAVVEDDLTLLRHMHTLRHLIASHDAAWDHIKHTGGVEHG